MKMHCPNEALSLCYVMLSDPVLFFRPANAAQPQRVVVQSVKMSSLPGPQRHPSLGNVSTASTTNTLTREDRKSIVAVRKINPGDKTEINLTKKDRGFGFSIRGGEGISLYVLRVAEGGAAHEDGRLKVRSSIDLVCFFL